MMTSQENQPADLLAEDRPVSIADLFAALRAGNMERAREIIQGSRHADGPYADFIDLLDGVLSQDGVAALAWRKRRLELLRAIEGKVAIGAAPFISPEAAVNLFDSVAVDDGVKPPFGTPWFRFVTIGESTRGQLSYQLPPGTGSFVFDVVLDLQTSVDDNFSIELVLADGSRERLLSLRDGGFTVYDQIAYSTPTLKVRRLFTFVLEPSRCLIYANGILCWRHKRWSKALFKGIEMTLVGVQSTTDGVVVRGFEIAQFSGVFPGFILGEAEQYQELARSLLLQKRARDLWMLRQSIEQIPLGGMNDDKLALLGELAKERGFREWLFEDVAATLPAELAVGLARPEPVIAVDRISVMFSRNPGKEFLLTRLLSRRKNEEFAVLNEIDFRVYPGDVVGIIGRNGAGKSTLLRALVATLPIRRGKILIRGRAMLLRPGLGMREELSGRENISIAAVYMGLSRRQIQHVIEDVIEFSELAEAIDRPIKYYSDGMRSRLIFSMATAISPEILLLDELLGAGDIGFRDKAARRLESFLGAAKAVIVVTHGIGFVREKCNKALYLKAGRLVYAGDPETACSRYLSELHNFYGHDPQIGIDDEDQMRRGL